MKQREVGYYYRAVVKDKCFKGYWIFNIANKKEWDEIIEAETKFKTESYRPKNQAYELLAFIDRGEYNGCWLVKKTEAIE